MIELFQRYREHLPTAVFAVLAVVAVLLCMQALSTRSTAADFADRIDSTVARLNEDPAAEQQSLEQEAASSDERRSPPRGPQGGEPSEASIHAAASERIVKSYKFVPLVEPFRHIKGVLGDRALFRDGQSAGVGGQIGEAKITAIGSDWVEFDLNGKTITIGVFGGTGSRPTP
ncbi:MAG: hypothetical protein AAF823_04960 [Planctomycetota bacterium]